ncbi:MULTISPECIES: hypothetical protein [unclassified Pseudomonas]|uniref:hypothetical protein n=1 Tax=unclassified Pseudomonas TaxID=196821 RepID=UPI001304B3C9|nr:MULTISPECIES: hypothetical protein [unclassified Pseudomonas]
MLRTAGTIRSMGVVVAFGLAGGARLATIWLLFHAHLLAFTVFAKVQRGSCARDGQAPRSGAAPNRRRERNGKVSIIRQE